MGTHILEIKAVSLRGTLAVGFGVDEWGRAFEIALDLGLAADIATALDDGQRPVVEIENAFHTNSNGERTAVGQAIARRDAGEPFGEVATNPAPTQSHEPPLRSRLTRSLRWRDRVT